jgi:hypothetical protein
VGLTEDTLALAFRTGLPYIGLRDHAHDPDLDRLIPPDAARAARAVPLAAEGDHVRLAVADPETDLSTLTPYLEEHEIELALAPREEIDAILGPPAAVIPEQPPRAKADGAGEAWTDRAIASEAGPQAGTEGEGASAAEAATDAAGGPQAGTEGEGAVAVEAETDAAGEPTAGTEGDGPIAVEAVPEATDEPRVSAEQADSHHADRGPAPGADAVATGAGDEAAAAQTAAESSVPEPAPDIAAAPEPAASPIAAPASADIGPDEVPSWLEPPSRQRRVLIAALTIFVLLVVAAALVVAFVNA